MEGVMANPDKRITALRRFAAAITILNVVGRAVLGFEPSWAQMFAAMATAYGLELLFERVDAWGHARPSSVQGAGIRQIVDFLLPGHITAMACSMLLYANNRIGVIVFTVAVGLGSKAVIRLKIRGAVRHFLNPSNTGITVVLLLFPWVGVAQPYQFTENVSGPWDAIIPCIIIFTGSLLNTRLTGRTPLIGAWLMGFAVQAVARSLAFGTPLAAGLGPMTGMAFLLFTFYMVTDPATTPVSVRGQLQFGAAVAVVYGLLQVAHVVYGLFFALAPVCLARGAMLLLRDLQDREVYEPRETAHADPALALESHPH